MIQIALHLEEKSIEEDLEYYYSEARDKHGQVRPEADIYSLTPDSTHISADYNDDKVGNFLYPVAPGSLDRIYIGISMPLFSNNWGASLLIQLLKTLKPDGAIVLPVYPEGQAAEKGYWSRSSLENIFLSRSRWKGISNISAENDGVMSLRVGRKWPERIASTAEWFYQQRTNLMLDQMVFSDHSKANGQPDPLECFFSTARSCWNNFAVSAIVERIIRDCAGQRRDLEICTVADDFGQLAMELLLSPYVNVCRALNYHSQSSHIRASQNLGNYFLPECDGKFNARCVDREQIKFDSSYDVVCINGSLQGLDQGEQQAMLEKAWKVVRSNGLLIVLERPYNETAGDTALDEMLEGLGPVRYFSRYVASELVDGVEISHYNKQIESALQHESETHEGVFRVISKP